MFVGIVQVELRLHTPDNLKEKRRIVRSLKDRIRTRYQVAIAEVGGLDVYRECVFGISLVSNDGRHARERCQAVVDFLENAPHAEVVDILVEVL